MFFSNNIVHVFNTTNHHKYIINQDYFIESVDITELQRLISNIEYQLSFSSDTDQEIAHILKMVHKGIICTVGV